MIFLYQYIKKYFFLFCISNISILATSMLSIFFVVVIQQTLNDVHSVNATSIFIKFSSIMAIISLFIIARVITTSYIIANVINNIRKEIYKNVINLHPYSNLKKRIGDIITTLNSDTVIFETCLSVQYPVFLRNISTTIISLIMLFITNIELCMYILLVMPIMLLLTVVLNKRVKIFSDKLRSSVGEFSSYIEEFLNKIQLIQSLNYENESITKINLLIKNIYMFFIKYSTFRSILIVSIIVTVFSSVSFITSIGIYNIVQNKISVADFTAFVLYLVVAVNSLSSAIESFSELIQLKSVIKRINELLNINNKKRSITYINENFTTIEFNNVSFSYPCSNINSIHNFSLKIKCKNKIAIVGDSGAGKSTIFQLLLGFYDTFTGTVMIDNININDINKNELHSFFSWVPQENSLFTGSIKENIKIGNQLASEDEIINIAEKTKITEFSNNLINGLNTIIGETNYNLSHGQKQRISIARALLKDSPVFLFDEPTSALDSINERDIMESINEISINKTVIMITHRFKNLKNFDRIIFMRDGKIIETGNHDELMNNKGHYYKMYCIESDEKQ